MCAPCSFPKSMYYTKRVNPVFILYADCGIYGTEAIFGRSTSENEDQHDNSHSSNSLFDYHLVYHVQIQ